MSAVGARWLTCAAGPSPALAFVAGVCFLQSMPALPPLAAAVVLLLPLAAFRFAAARRPAFILLLALVGFFYAAWRADVRLQTTLPDELIWRDVRLEGTVQGAPVFSAERTRFDFAVTQIVAPVSLTVKMQARLNIYHRGESPPPLLAEGARLRLDARLRHPQSSFNPHGFDYAGYLFARNIRFVGYVRHVAEMRELPGSAPNGGFRRQVGRRIAASGAPQTALLEALVIGDRSGIDDDGWRVLRRTGTAHLVSVSGTHIGLVYLLVAGVIGLLWGAHVRLIRFVPKAKAALLLSLPAALAYALLAGFGVPVRRSFIMLATAAAVVLVGGVRAATTALALAMLAVVAVDPWAVVSPGFWLSFALTGALLFVTLTRPPDEPMWRRLLGAQLFASLLAVPLTLWFFNEASIASPLANLVAVPVVGFAALPLALAGVFAGDICWFAAGWILEYLWRFLELLSALPFAAWSPAQAPGWLFILAIGGGCWMLLPRGVPYRFCGLLPIAAMLLWSASPPPPGTLRVTLLDVGQGSAVVLQTAAHAMVYDTGRAHGGRVITDFLRGGGAREIDKLLISHDDYDHRGGAAFLREGFSVREEISTDGDKRCVRGDGWEWDGVEFSILHPRAPVAADHNDNSCVLVARARGGGKILLLGDISAKVERQLAGLSTMTVLHVAHHGSRYSSDVDFLRRVRPQAAIISVGRNNYGHPHQQTLRRLRAVGAEVWRTDEDGALVIEIDADAKITAWRDKVRRYWNE